MPNDAGVPPIYRKTHGFTHQTRSFRVERVLDGKQIVMHCPYKFKAGPAATVEWDVGLLVDEYGSDMEYVIYNLWETIIEKCNIQAMTKFPDIKFKMIDNHVKTPDAVGWPESDRKDLIIPDNVEHVPSPWYFLWWSWHLARGNVWRNPDPDHLFKMIDDHDHEIKSHYCFNNGKARQYRTELWNLFKEDGLINEYCSYLFKHHRSPLNPNDMVIEDWLSYSSKAIHRAMSPQPYYNETLIDIHVETDIDFIRNTEKSCKPLLHRKINLSFTGAGYYKWLESQGFRLHKNIIDYSFDSNVRPRERMYGLYKQFKNLLKIPLEELKRITYEDREFNHNRCLDILERNNDIWESDVGEWRGKCWGVSPTFFNLASTEVKEYRQWGRVLSEEERG